VQPEVRAIACGQHASLTGWGRHHNRGISLAFALALGLVGDQTIPHQIAPTLPIQPHRGRPARDLESSLEPSRLREVTGIGPKRAERIIAGWAEQKVIREIMLFLHSNGVGTSRAVRIYKT
jgi:hypothetical protein